MSKKIIFASPFFPPFAPGGAEHSLEQTCERFANRGWDVTVVSACYDDKPRRVERDGYFLVLHKSPIKLEPGQNIDAQHYLNSWEYYKTLSAALISEIKRKPSTDAIIANNIQSLRAVAKAGKVTGIPTLSIIRDTQPICATGACIDNKMAQDAIPCKGILGAALCNLRFFSQRGVTGYRPIPGLFFSGLQNGLIRYSLQRHLFLNVDGIITISLALKALVVKCNRKYESKIHNIYNFYTCKEKEHKRNIDSFLNTLGIKDIDFFLVAGKKSYGKGSDVAVKAIERVCRKYPQTRLLFVGKGDVDYKDNNLFIDHAPVSQSMLIGLLLRAKALVVPGRWQEGLHRTMLDAVSNGVPVITTWAGGVREGVRDGYNGYVVSCNNHEALADKMCRIIEWSESDKDVCKATSADIFREKFSDEKIFEQWEQCLASVITK